jgi:hypothetical protein
MTTILVRRAGEMRKAFLRIVRLITVCSQRHDQNDPAPFILDL